ncbi:MAG: tetratricopeptide repeat protein [Verrucomicrobiota bacterium]
MRRTVILFFFAGLCGLALAIGCGGPPGDREFRNGVREIERGHYVRAKALMEKSVTKRPGSDANAAAYNYVGLASYRLEQIESAKEAFENSRRLDPSLPDPAYNLAVILLESGDLPRAIAFFEEASRLDTADPRALEYLGWIHARAGRWDDARRALISALARAPRSPRILTALAVAEREAGVKDRAAFYLMQALESKPDYAPALFDLGVLYQKDVKDKEQALAHFRKYLDAAGEDPHAEYARKAVEDLAPAVPAPKLPPVPAAIEPTAPERKPERPAAPPAQPQPKARTADDLLNQARAEAAKNRVQAALDLCLEAAGKGERAQDAALQEKALREGVKLATDQARAHHALGRFLYDRGQNDAALNSFKQAIVLDRKFAPAYLGIADAAVRTGESDAALVALKEAVQLEPNNADVYWALASLYDQQMQIAEKAAHSYREFEKRFPGDPRVLKVRERLKILAPSPQAGAVEPSVPAQPAVPAAAPAEQPLVTAAPAAQEPSPERPPARRIRFKRPVVRNTHAAVQAYNRGTLYQQQEDWERAIYYYIRAIENDDTFATAFFNLAAVYSAKRDYDLAKDAYQRAIAIRPDMVAARYNLGLIHRELKEQGAAVEQLAALLKVRPDHAPAHFLLGMIYADDPDTAGLARQHYEKFLELAPSDPSAPAVRQWLETH